MRNLSLHETLRSWARGWGAGSTRSAIALATSLLRQSFERGLPQELSPRIPGLLRSDALLTPDALHTHRVQRAEVVLVVDRQPRTTPVLRALTPRCEFPRGPVVIVPHLTVDRFLSYLHLLTF
jgi:hypothetical protein